MLTRHTDTWRRPRPKYQRRHYEQFAQIVRGMLNEHDTDAAFSLDYVHDFTGKLCDTFTRDNPYFNRRRFLAACGITTQD